MAVKPYIRLSPEDASILLSSGFVAVCEHQMRRAGPDRPRIRDLIASGQLVYCRVDVDEHWVTYDEIIEIIARDGVCYVDCEDLASNYAAELRVDGLDPDANIYVYRTGPQMSHVVTNSQVFGLLDPSKQAGM